MTSSWEKTKFQFKYNIRQIKSVFLFCESENEFQTVAILSDNSIQMKTFKQDGESYVLGKTIYSDTPLRETILEEDERPWHVQKFQKKFFIFKLGQPRTLEETQPRTLEETQPRTLEETQPRTLEETQPRTIRQETAGTRTYYELDADGILMKHVIKKAENFFFEMYFKEEEGMNQIKEAIMENEEGEIEYLFFNGKTTIILLENNDGIQKIIKYENNEKKTLASNEKNIKTFVVSKDGQCVVIIFDEIIKVIQNTQVKNYPVRTLFHSDFVAFDLKGDQNSGYTFVLATDKKIRIFEILAKGSALLEKNTLSREVHSLCMAPDCNKIYVVENDGNNNNFQLEVFKNLILK